MLQKFNFFEAKYTNYYNCFQEKKCLDIKIFYTWLFFIGFGLTQKNKFIAKKHLIFT